jgi:hypothetical protein
MASTQRMEIRRVARNCGYIVDSLEWSGSKWYIHVRKPNDNRLYWRMAYDFAEVCDSLRAGPFTREVQLEMLRYAEGPNPGEYGLEWDATIPEGLTAKEAIETDVTRNMGNN